MGSAAISERYAATAAQVLGREFRSSFVPEATPIVFVLDKDASLRESLGLIIRHEGWRSEAFASAEEFLKFPQTVVPNCLVLDASLPGHSALDLQKRITMDRPGTSIIFIAGRVDVATTVKAMKAGAVGFFTKPLPEDALLATVREALESSRVNLAREAEMRGLCDRYGTLSRREREVMALVVSGLLNKQVGSELGISEITVKAHRGQAMQKMKADSLPDLVKMAEKLRLTLSKDERCTFSCAQLAPIPMSSSSQLPV